MKAVTYKTYGSPDVLKIEELQKPQPGDNGLLIKMHSSIVTAVDCTFRRGNELFARLFTGITKPKYHTPGSDLAGEIEAVGKDVTKFKKGDMIIAVTKDGFGAHAEYICIPQDGVITLKPDNLNCTDAAAVAYGTLTALPFIRDTANTQKGNKVLIIGAAGSIGIYAVQFAKYYGAEVTGVCSAANADMVKSLGADHVIDYTKEAFTESALTYDVIFDSVGKSSFSECKKLLAKSGMYMTTVMSFTIIFQMLTNSISGNKKAKLALTGLRKPDEKNIDLQFIKDLIESGKLKPVVDRTYPLENASEAHRYVENGHKKGNVILTMESRSR